MAHTTDLALDMRHILLVEDNPQDVELLALAFAPFASQLAYTAVPNAISCLDFLARRGRYCGVPTPQLIILDLNLPIQSGGLVLHEIAKDAAWRRIPVVVLSSSQRKEDVDDSYKHGAMLYVVKPAHWDRWTDLAASFARLAGCQTVRPHPSSRRSTAGIASQRRNAIADP